MAKKLSVNVQTVGNWEVGRDQPDFWYMPRVVEFLGYDPRPKAETKTLREELLAYRLKHRLTQKALSARLRVNTCIISGWKKGKVVPMPVSAWRGCVGFWADKNFRDGVPIEVKLSSQDINASLRAVGETR